MKYTFEFDNAECRDVLNAVAAWSESPAQRGMRSATRVDALLQRLLRETREQDRKADKRPGPKAGGCHVPSQAALREIRNLVFDLNHMATSDEGRARTAAILDYLDGSEPGGEGVPVFRRVGD